MAVEVLLEGGPRLAAIAVETDSMHLEAPASSAGHVSVYERAPAGGPS